MASKVDRWDIEADRLNRGGGRSMRLDLEAANRSFENGLLSLRKRLRRAGFSILLVIALLIMLTVFGGSASFLAWIFGFPLIFAAALLALLWPTRRRGAERVSRARPVPTSAVPLGTIAGETERWLLARAAVLPRPAGVSLERIVTRLREMAPALAHTDPDSAVGGEARRLIGSHLPGLVNSFVGLPRGAVTGEDARALTESLDMVADAMDDLCERIGCERRAGFETERRFIETRYGERTGLNLDK